jgi:hypothetical protein
MKTFDEERRELMQWYIDEHKKLDKSILTEPTDLSCAREYNIAWDKLAMEKRRRLRLLEAKYGIERAVQEPLPETKE